MRVKVSDIVGVDASTPDAGLRLHAIIGSALDSGDSVILDFEGMRHCGVPFLCYSVGSLIEHDTERRLPELLRFENLSDLGRSAWDSVVEYATRRRENPRWAEAMDEAARKRSSEAWE